MPVHVFWSLPVENASATLWPQAGSGWFGSRTPNNAQGRYEILKCWTFHFCWVLFSAFICDLDSPPFVCNFFCSLENVVRYPELRLVPPAFSPSKVELWPGITIKLGRGIVDFFDSAEWSGKRTAECSVNCWNLGFQLFPMGTKSSGDETLASVGCNMIAVSSDIESSRTLENVIPNPDLTFWPTS